VTITGTGGGTGGGVAEKLVGAARVAITAMNSGFSVRRFIVVLPCAEIAADAAGIGCP